MKRRTLAMWGLLLLVCIGVLVCRVFWQGRSALAEGDRAHQAGRTDDAIRWWRRAARWYLPGAPHVSGAYDRLEELARQAETRGDRETALSAWRGVRSSIRATRSFYTPHADRLDHAERRVAALMAALEDPGLAPGQDEEERARWHYQLLARDGSPAVGWVLVAALGFLLWVGGAFAFALRAVDDDDQLVTAAAAYSGAAVGLGLIVWLAGLYQA